MILILYVVIILFSMVLVVRLVKHVYKLCNFNNLLMQDSYVKQNFCPITVLGNNSDVFLKISSIQNFSSVRIYWNFYGLSYIILISENLKKKDIDYHNSVLHDEINFDWPRIEFTYQYELIFLPSAIQVPLHGKFKTG